MAILAARKLKEAFRVLYIPGTIAILWAIGFVPFQSLSSSDYAFVDGMPNRDFLVDKWACHHARLTLSSDSTFVYAEFGMATAGGDTVWQTGTWQLAGGIVVLSPAQEEYTLRWPVLESDGRQFIAHRIPANLEDWDGNLGLMREEEWRIVSGRY